jgi:hypothetical protein
LDGVYSRGSAIHLKLLFPITLKKKNKWFCVAFLI